MLDVHLNAKSCSQWWHSTRRMSESCSPSWLLEDRSCILSHYEWLALPHDIEAAPGESVARECRLSMVTPFV